MEGLLKPCDTILDTADALQMRSALLGHIQGTMAESIRHTWFNLGEQKHLREEEMFVLMSEDIMCMKSLGF